MAWNDGATKELNEYLETLSSGGKVDIGQTYINSLKKEIDRAIGEFSDFVSPEIPVETGGLKKSFKITKITTKRNWYGYRAEFEGNAPNGQPYEKIANVLNYGSPGKMAGKFFITRAVRRLKGLDDKIEKVFLSELNRKAK